MYENHLKLNDEKTEFIVLVPKYYNERFQKMNYTLRIGQDYIKPKSFVQNLGLHIESNVSMDKQISSTIKSVYYQLRSISKIRKYLNKDTCAKVVNALVTSRLDFNNAVLTGLPSCMYRKLQLLQNHAARVVFREGKSCHINPILYKLHWLPIQQRIKYKVCVFVFKCVHFPETVPIYLSELLEIYRPQRMLRSNSDGYTLVIPRTRKSYGDKSFRVSGPKFWNKLPFELRHPQSLSVFKRNLKTYLFREYFNC